jgi:hypothetical protein
MLSIQKIKYSDHFFGLLRYCFAFALISFMAFGCVEKIELDDSDNISSTFDLQVEKVSDNVYQLKWNPVLTKKFVRYRVVRSSAPISEQDITTNGSLQFVGTFTDVNKKEVTVSLGFDQSQTTYFRVVAEYTDRIILSSQVNTSGNSGLRIPFTMDDVLITSDRNFLYGYAPLKDSIYLIDLNTYEIVSRLRYTLQMESWCVGQVNGVQQLYIKSSIDIRRYSGANMDLAQTLVVSSFGGASEMLFVQDEIVVSEFNLSPRKIIVYDAQTITRKSSLDLINSVSTWGGVKMQTLDRVTKRFCVMYTSSYEIFNINPNNSITLNTDDFFSTNNVIQPKWIEDVVPGQMFSSQNFWIDLTTGSQQFFPFQTNSVFSAQFSEDGKSCIASELFFGNNQLEVKLSKFSFSNNVIEQVSNTPYNGVIPSSSGSINLIFDHGQRYIWVRNESFDSFQISSIQI